MKKRSLGPVLCLLAVPALAQNYAESFDVNEIEASEHIGKVERVRSRKPRGSRREAFRKTKQLRSRRRRTTVEVIEVDRPRHQQRDHDEGNAGNNRSSS